MNPIVDISKEQAGGGKQCSAEPDNLSEAMFDYQQAHCPNDLSSRKKHIHALQYFLVLSVRCRIFSRMKRVLNSADSADRV